MKAQTIGVNVKCVCGSNMEYANQENHDGWYVDLYTCPCCGEIKETEALSSYDEDDDFNEEKEEE